MTTTPLTASTTLNRRHALAMGAGALAIGLGWALSARAAQPKPLVEVWKDPNCGCCKDWMSNLESEGFTVKAYDKGNTAARAAFGMPQALGSCHTAKV